MNQRKIWKIAKRQEVIVAVFSLLVFIFFSVFSDNFFTPTNLKLILQQYAVNGICVLGISIVVILGGIDLSAGAVLAMAGSVSGTLVKAGMKMAGLVPSTMGTLMSSGVMEGGKALKGKKEIGAEELSIYLTAFAAGIQKRGKCELGDRTIFDSVDAGAKKAAEAAAAGGDMASVIEAACEGAAEGVEATKNMTPKFGKAAVFAAKAAGVPDQGAIAGMYMIQGLRRSICE